MLQFPVVKKDYFYNQIDSKTEIYGVIGDPIEQSLSPAVHNAAFRHLGLNKVMVPFLVPGGDLETFFRELLWLDIKGCSVTIPHKEAIVSLPPADGRGRRADRGVQHGRLRWRRPADRPQHGLPRGHGVSRGRHGRGRRRRRLRGIEPADRQAGADPGSRWSGPVDRLWPDEARRPFDGHQPARRACDGPG